MPDLAAALDSAVERVFETMFFTAVLDCGGPPPEAPLYTASLPFSGSRSGVLMVAASRRTAAALCASFLGDAGAEITPAHAQSSIGEMANVLCGSLLGAVDSEGRYTIGPPSVSSGAEAAAAVVGSMPLRRVYLLDEGPVAVAVELSGEPS